MERLKKLTFLNRSEKMLLDKYFVFAQALETGKREPKTANERYFIKVCRGQAPPKTDYQMVYWKYLEIKNYMQHMENRQNMKDNKKKCANIINNNPLSEINKVQQKEQAILAQKRKENGEALLIMAERKKEREKVYPGSNIPEYEEGFPRREWGSREDHKKMRAHDWGDMKKRQTE